MTLLGGNGEIHFTGRVVRSYFLVNQDHLHHHHPILDFLWKKVKKTNADEILEELETVLVF